MDYSSGKTVYDLVWLAYKDIVDSHPEEVTTTFDRYWLLSNCMKAATLSLSEEERIKVEAEWLDKAPLLFKEGEAERDKKKK